MRALRLAVGTIGGVLLTGGYFASQWSYFSGDPAAYVRSLDASAVPLLALLLLVAAAILACVPTDRPEGQE